MPDVGVIQSNTQRVQGAATARKRSDSETVQRGIQVANQILDALDKAGDGVGDGKLHPEDFSRIGLIDNFLTRKFLFNAWKWSVWRDDPERSVASVKEALLTAKKSLDKAAKRKGTGEQYPQEVLEVASIRAKELFRFAQAHSGKKLSDFKIKPYEKPGTLQWAKLAAKEYYNPRSEVGSPRFGTALILSRAELPAALRSTYDKFARTHPEGLIEASSWTENDAVVFAIHSKLTTKVDAVIADAKGNVFLSGVATPKGTTSTDVNLRPWNIRWRSARD